MFLEDENDLLIGSVRSKFYNVIFNANRNLVSNKLEETIKKYLALELFLEKEMGQNLDKILASFIDENAEELEKELRNFYLHFAGEVLSQNE